MKESDLIGGWKVYNTIHTGERSMYMGSYTLTILDNKRYSETTLGFPLSMGDYSFNSKDSILTLVPNESYLKVEELHPLMKKYRYTLGYEKVFSIIISKEYDNTIMTATRENLSECDEYNSVEKMIMIKL